ncbi:MAG: peroxiredoxin family protein, partial [Gammaproteobacteria bacterium]|nr:peroxiredoxin family protein [Gammaproteobacteria bacterium]
HDNKHQIFMTIPVLAGLVLTFSTYITADAGDAAAMFAAIISAVGYVLYISWYSTFRHGKNTLLTVGGALPDFEVDDIGGRKVRSSSLKGRPAIYIFYRGNWCPFCMAQITELAVKYKDSLSGKGLQIALISPQPHGRTWELARRLDVPFKFWVDSGNLAARELDIIDSHGVPFILVLFGYDYETVLPTAIMTDEDGKIIYVDQTDTYRVRPKPEEFLNALESIK